MHYTKLFKSISNKFIIYLNIIFFSILWIFIIYNINKEQLIVTNSFEILPIHRSKLDISKTNEDNIEEKIETIAKVLWCEDRKNEEGMKLVLSVISNRSKSKDIDGIYSEIIKPYQFECYSKLMKGLIKVNDLKMYNYALKLVRDYYNEKFKPITSAKFFYNPRLMKNKHPKWATRKILVGIYNGHWFYN